MKSLQDPRPAPPSFAGKRALVTGGAGFIGSHLVEGLRREGAEVTVLDNLQAGKWENLVRQKTEDRSQKSGNLSQKEQRPASPPSADCSPGTSELRHLTSDLGPQISAIRCIEADVRNADQVAESVRDVSPEYTFHLAANASVPGSVENPRYDFESNATGTYNILEACRGLQGLRKIVVVSSGAVYGEPASFPITEASPLAPISPYGASKLVAETEARMFESAYSVPAVIARIFNTYGPRMPRFVVFDFLRKLQKDPMRLEILGSGRQVRDLNYVSDTVDGLLTLAAQGLPGESYNIASGTSHAVTEIAQALLSILGLDGRTTLAFTGESWAGDAQRWEVEIGKLRQLGYEPEIGLKEGLRRVAEWFESVYGPLPATPDSELRTLNSEPRTP